jgi:uncharacterized protein (DUF2141 family)
MTIMKNLNWLLCIILFGSCARQSAPTGGPKDTIPPVLIKSIPPDETISFRAKELQLLFSEDVILNTPKEQLIVTPSIGKDYKITYKKNMVILSFAQPLQDSTTYTFNFREAVQDITEKNPVKNLQLAYSTCTYIDSLSISGTVYNLLRGKVVKDATVALHVENDTFNILKHPAVIFTKTEEDGKFKISHLKPGKYFVYGIDDKNRNLVVNSRTESYGFLGEYQYLTDSLSGITIGLVRLDASPLKVTSARPYNTYFNVRFTKNLRSFQLTGPDSSNLSYTFGENNANIKIYKTNGRDSTAVHLVALDSIDNKIDTTLYAKYLDREVTPEKFDLALPSSSLLVDKGELEATLTFTKPVGELNFDSIYFQVDSLTRLKFTPANLAWDPLLRKFTITKTIDPALYPSEESPGSQKAPTRIPQRTKSQAKKPPISNQLYFGKGAFMSIENDSSKRITQTLKPTRQQDLAIINIEIRTNEKSFLVQLLDNNYKIVQEVRNKPKVRFENVSPAEYQIRLVIDKNSNGRWDSGNYFKREEPEPILYYHASDGTTAIKGVKANWDIGNDGEMFITY